MPFLRDIPGMTPNICSTGGAKSTLAAGTFELVDIADSVVFEADGAVVTILRAGAVVEGIWVKGCPQKAQNLAPISRGLPQFEQNFFSATILSPLFSECVFPLCGSIQGFF
jgi:hypothetical protein